MSAFFPLVLLWCCTLGVKAPAHRTTGWTKVQNAHFEIDSQSGPTTAGRDTLQWFEQLRAFFQENGLLPEIADSTSLRIVCFRSQPDYEQYRPHSNADAVYLSVPDGDFILMARCNPRA